MSTIADLNHLIQFATPQLNDGEFVFLSLPVDYSSEILKPVCTCQETEGLSIIVSTDRAIEAGLTFDRKFSQITLAVNSSLEAVGFLAAITAALAKAGIPCNAVSAFHHDHLFVPVEDAERAMKILSGLAK